MAHQPFTEAEEARIRELIRDELAIARRLEAVRRLGPGDWSPVEPACPSTLRAGRAS